ncbi:hypothetical protein XU18_1791 [Perkinsela sp. CCAP 1560/4]|nr:hypothetical protein XU18_3843 [Perkinsela sp. CCAP 1560/4]KNH07570.1 hypothetical protein XU18_1791 [Perkinsela sp. CCAP 1560/4]|eukprot:KNH05028.1 hypothetical protein XU18_3843 [Perkinsela sp. CCAP 1560/4]
MHSGFMFICVDPPADDQAVAWQNALMKLFFADISDEGIQSFSRDYERGGSYCHGWTGVYCRDGNVDRIYFFQCQHGNFNPSALPHSTTSIDISSSEQTFQMHTRSLPRQLTYLNLSANRICGRVDLMTLPPKLESALLWGNRLTGPIYLTNLPDTLYLLQLQKNMIHQNVVWYDNLPKPELTYPEQPLIIVLAGSKAERETNRIGKVRAVDRTKAAPCTTFPKFPPTNVY